jgi:hypothetical protein
MVNASGSVGYQQLATQPAIVAGADAPARAESVQPRQAPAADSQRADQKPLASRDEPPPPPPPKQADSGRGSAVDVSA